MSRFTASNRSTATLDATRVEIWKALTDPELLPRLTPYLRSIDVDGDRWHWNMARIPVLGRTVGTSFTQLMDFEEPHRIGFTHDGERAEERTWVEGEYLLGEVRAGTAVTIDLAVTSELPFPGLARPAVETAMSAVMAGIGRRFGSNLVRHLRAG
jgi:carbon monoxide dehydrogenase subunit G